MNIDIEHFTKVTKQTFEQYAKESLEVEYIKGTLYAFGSELATLRLFYVYRHCGDKAAFEYSQTYKSHYFRLETDIQSKD